MKQTNPMLTELLNELTKEAALGNTAAVEIIKAEIDEVVEELKEAAYHNGFVEGAVQNGN